MGLTAKAPPAGGSGIIREALANLASGPPTDLESLAAGAPSNLNIAAPHPFYFVGLTDVAEGRLLAGAILKGWRYIVLQDDETIGTANLIVSEQDQSLQFSHISHGPFAQNTVEGIRRAESLPDVANDDYELRLLDIPGLYVVALWLHGVDDKLIPLPPTNRVLEPYKSYSEGEMTAALREPALQRLESEPLPDPI
jgi:hypothetical protein